ncbi:SatD family protein [Hoeflea ulvae]|uniref:SatD family protein n=1 Tax=Hoeflea ulvae TaxID=2983764 RepID=A0ABT3YIJ6_9HYPH|nr:SatD family protein [Hoeflea ulvae]MCY0095643.1 SatD family protein [Hoeflea ulvae]
MTHSTSSFAVLMGDLVGSERHANPKTLHAHFNAAIDRQNEVLAADMVSPLTITLGDEFQGLLSSLVAAAQAAREIRFELMRKNIDCRFVIGSIDLKTQVNHERAWNMMGPGFAAARARLSEKRSPSRYRFSIQQDALLETMLEASGASLTTIERRWSEAQREDIIKLLEGASVAEIARARNVSVHNVYKVRSAGDFDLYVIQWDAIQKALAELDRRYELPGADKWCTHSFTPA